MKTYFFLVFICLLGLSSASVINSSPLIAKLDNETIGTTAVDLDGSNCKQAECNLGNLAADSVRYEYLAEHSTGEAVTDVLVLLQGSAFKGVIEKGTEVKRSDLSASMSKNAPLVHGKLKGSVIKGVLEKSVEKYTQKGGSPDFLQVSGGIFAFDFALEDGKRLTKAQLLSTETSSFIEIKDDTDYDVAMTEDLSKGQFSAQTFVALNSSDVDALEKFIKKHQIVYPAVDERIVLYNIDKAPEGNAAMTLKTSSLLIALTVLLQKFLSSA